MTDDQIYLAESKKLLLELAEAGAPRPGSEAILGWLDEHVEFQARYITIGNWLTGRHLDELTTEPMSKN